MPSVTTQVDELASAVNQIALTSSDADYIDQLIPFLRDTRYSDRAGQLVHALNQVAGEHEAEIEAICNSNHQDFIASVKQLMRVQQGTAELTAEILSLSQSIQASTEHYAEQKKNLVDSRAVRQNIDDTTTALNACLDVLRLVNQVHDLLSKKKHFAALRALDELRNVHLREIGRYKIAEIIDKSVPAIQRLIAEAVTNDLNTWLFRIREASQYLGEVAFYHTELRRRRMKERVERDDYLTKFKLGSAVELVADEMDEFDILNDEETEISVDFSPLFECMHIHDTLGRLDQFKLEYAATRRRQKELLIPTSLDLLDDNEDNLSSLLESIAGFAIVERATTRKTENFRAEVDVIELWESMCQSAITLASSALHNVENDEKLLKIKGRIALFIQTMDNWNYSTAPFNNLLLSIFDKYSQLLKKRFSEDFQEIVATDDYMPMPINSLDEFDKVVNVSWYTPERPRQELTFPCVLPFSQMYPLCCIDIRNFLNQIYLFSDDYFQRTSVIDETLRTSLDDLLTNNLCASLISRLSSQYPGQIVQILTNLEHFETACVELQNLLFEARSSSTATGPVELQALEHFRVAKKTAEKRIFELVNSKIDDLIETAEYDWMSRTPQSEPSLYMQELTRYLSVNMNSVLLGLPTEIKELIYFDALSHAANSILALPLSDLINTISPASVATLSNDAKFLTGFVGNLGNSVLLQQTLDELTQTIDLMGTENPEEFFDIGVANRRYGRVDRTNGAVLLEKVREGRERFGSLSGLSGGRGSVGGRGSASGAVVSGETAKGIAGIGGALRNSDGLGGLMSPRGDVFGGLAGRFGINRSNHS